MIVPDYIQIALSNFCNLRCKICIQNSHKFAEVKREFMENDIFLKVVDGIRNGINPHSVFLFWNDEPTLHPEFEGYFLKLIELLKIGNIKELILSTNGTFLEKYGEILTENGDERVKIILSIDGASSETYRNIRGGDFEKLLRGVEFLLKSRGKRKGPIFTYQFVVTDLNYHEIDRFIKLSEELAQKYSGYRPETRFSRGEFKRDTIYIRCPFPWGDSKRYEFAKSKFVMASKRYGDLIGVEEAGKVASPRGERICRNMFHGIVVHPSGDISPCCVDFDGSICFGSLKDETLFDIYHGRKSRRYREGMIRNRMEEIPERCKECLLPEGSTIDIEEITDY